MFCGVLLPRSVWEHCSHFPSSISSGVLPLSPAQGLADPLWGHREWVCAGSATATFPDVHFDPISSGVGSCKQHPQISNHTKPLTHRDLLLPGFSRWFIITQTLQSGYFNPRTSLLPCWFPPQLLGGQGQITQGKDTFPVKEALLGALQESPQHLLPLTLPPR